MIKLGQMVLKGVIGYTMQKSGQMVLKGVSQLGVVLHNLHNLPKHPASASSQHGAVHVMCSVQNKELNPPHLHLLLFQTTTNITVGT